MCLLIGGGWAPSRGNIRQCWNILSSTYQGLVCKKWRFAWCPHYSLKWRNEILLTPSQSETSGTVFCVFLHGLRKWCFGNDYCFHPLTGPRSSLNSCPFTQPLLAALNLTRITSVTALVAFSSCWAVIWWEDFWISTPNWANLEKEKRGCLRRQRARWITWVTEENRQNIRTADGTDSCPHINVYTGTAGKETVGGTVTRRSVTVVMW